MLPASALPLLVAMPREETLGRDPLVAQETHQLPLPEAAVPLRKYRAVPQFEDSTPKSLSTGGSFVDQFEQALSPNRRTIYNSA
jgi:hypothetical protein